jgi:hypothetical protein
LTKEIPGVGYGPWTAFVAGGDDLFHQLRVLSGSEQRWTSMGELPAVIRVSLSMLFDVFIDHPPVNLKDSSNERKRHRMLETTPQNAAYVDVLFQAAAAALKMLASM